MSRREGEQSRLEWGCKHFNRWLFDGTGAWLGLISYARLVFESRFESTSSRSSWKLFLFQFRWVCRGRHRLPILWFWNQWSFQFDEPHHPTPIVSDHSNFKCPEIVSWSSPVTLDRVVDEFFFFPFAFDINEKLSMEIKSESLLRSVTSQPRCRTLFSSFSFPFSVDFHNFRRLNGANRYQNVRRSSFISSIFFHADLALAGR